MAVELLTTAEACLLLRVSRSKLYTLRSLYKLKVTHFGPQTVRWPRRELERLAERLTK